MNIAPRTLYTAATSPLLQAAQPGLLAVLAHPDDESFGMGGTLARYAWSGVAVHLICATGGEMGDMDEQFLQGYASATERREAELRCAAEHLGLRSVQLLGYRDSGMPGTPANTHPQALAAAPRAQVIAQVVHAIRSLRPQVVITFDPIGGYRHPDHIAIQRATVQAFHAAGDYDYVDDLEGLPPYAPQKLYFSTFPRFMLRTFVALMPLFGQDPRRFGRNADIDIAAIAAETFPIHARIDVRTVETRRQAAIQCHASQLGGPSVTRGIVSAMLQVMGSGDTFMRAFPPPTPGLHERDLFAGVTF
jgi:N-acetyl-1-D-myo-inositol-2-amino-2-deoxy-alpha-D-glucopyranoside deacetylase/mycothiol S-conjugate amidase